MRTYCRCLVGVSVLCVAGVAWGELFTLRGTTYPVGPNPVSVACTDLNADGLVDIVVTSIGALSSPREERPANDELWLLEGQEGLNFRAAAPLRTGFAPYKVVVANVDALRAPDLVCANFLATRDLDLTLFRNLGDRYEKRDFTVPDESAPYKRMLDGDGLPVFSTPGLTDVVVTDFDGDGYRDAMATGWSADDMVLFHGDKEAYFAEPELYALPGGPRSLALGDFDEDGKQDVAVALYISGEIAVFSTQDGKPFNLVNRFPSRAALPQTIKTGDINGDGHTDIVVSHCHASDSIVIFYGDGDFHFSMSQVIALDDDPFAITHEIRDMVLEDLNEDGRLDIVAACHKSQQVKVLLNTTGDTPYPMTYKEETYKFRTGYPRAIAVADVDNDGKRDIVTATWGTNAIAILLNQGK